MNRSPEEQRDTLRNDELKNNAIGNLKDHSQYSESGNLTSSMSTKALGLLILALIIFGFIGWLVVH
ncbi:DUF6366 family protein [Macrococcus equi]|uniref:DUF6366 family protein n=1 Tax=Macrococcus equi TaxID=3395462 RepID=UPI0039BEC55F